MPPILSRMIKPATKEIGRGTANTDYRTDHTITPSTSATSVVVISRVRRGNRQLTWRIQGAAASAAANVVGSHDGRENPDLLIFKWLPPTILNVSQPVVP